MMLLEYDWEPAEGVKTPELRATWARLKMVVDGHVVTQVSDASSRSVRPILYLPLYPLAEWIVSHWFALFCESEVPGKADPRDFRRRHALRFASEGFALPDLEIVPEGRSIRMAWEPLSLPSMGLEFQTSGEARVGRDELKSVLCQFLDTVVCRLEADDGAPRTFLQSEWEAIKALDSEEVEFCEAAASLGLDPFSLDKRREEELLEVGNSVPGELREDFFSAALPDNLRAHLEWVSEALNKAVRQSGAADALPGLRRHAQSSFSAGYSSAPWNYGYECARSLRKYLGIAGELMTPHDFEEKLGYASADWIVNDVVNLDALAVRDSASQAASFILSGRSETSRRFAFARALFEYLEGDASRALVTRAVTNRQRQNRAFAAELLAPAESLSGRMRHGTVSHEQIDDLAEEYKVSPFVIRHQIENHRLARVMPV